MDLFQVLDLYSPQPQSSGGDSPTGPPPAKVPKNDKKPLSVTPPTSASPVAAVAAKAVVTPNKNGAELKFEPPKLEPLRYTYPAYPGLAAYAGPYAAPPPGLAPRLAPPPLLYAEPRFPPVNVPPPNYFPPLPGRGPPPPGPPPRPYYPPT